MYAFNYERPDNKRAALKLIKAGGRPLAGGQTLLGSMKLRLASPDMLVDLGGISEFVGIEKNRHGLSIGAMTRHVDVANSTEVQHSIPALAELAGGIGDRQVRAMGTIGGSVANDDPAADYPAALLGLGATVHTSSRKIAADDFFLELFTTALKEKEIITSVSFPIPQRAAYVKFPQPASLFALIGVFIAQFDKEIRVAITGGGNGVFRQREMESALRANLSPGAVTDIKTDEAHFTDDLHGSRAYRASLVNVITQRAVAKLLA